MITLTDRQTMNTNQSNPQDRNAGNLGDVLKHYWLLRLVEAITEVKSTTKITYLESHAGAGLYSIGSDRVQQMQCDKKRVESNPLHWRQFDQFQDKLAMGQYSGSCRLALRYLEAWANESPEREVRAHLWEMDQSTSARLNTALSNLSLKGIKIHENPCTPDSFTHEVRKAERDSKVVWLCDPFWGEHKREDRQWVPLLEKLSNTAGILFVVVGGDSTLTGPAKFHYDRVTGLDRNPCFRKDNGIRSYGLYLTATAKDVLKIA